MAEKKKEHLSRKQKFLLRQAAEDRLENVRLLVEKHLQGYQPNEYRLITVPGAVMEHGGFWYVQVEPDDPKASIAKHAGRLLEVEVKSLAAKDCRSCWCRSCPWIISLSMRCRFCGRFEAKEACERCPDG